MSVVLGEVLAILLLIGINGLLSMSEMSLVSAKRVRLEKRARNGERGAKAALELLENPTRFLSSIQIGITLIGIMTGVFGGATIGEELARYFEHIPLLSQHAESASIFVIVIVVTYFSLVAGELAPKRLAMRNPEALAVRMAYPMLLMTKLAAPAVDILSRSTDLLLTLLGAQKTENSTAVEEEIRLLLREGTQSGVLADNESRMVESVFSLDDRKAETIMTPRVDIEWVDYDADPGDIRERLVTGSHTIYPVGRGTLDNMTGYIRSHDIVCGALQGRPLVLDEIILPGLYLPSTSTALSVLESLRKEGTSVAFLVDEHGGLVGMVTLRDLLESIVGFIPDSDEKDSPQVVMRGDGSYLVNGMLSLHDFLLNIGEDSVTGEEIPDYNTVGGLVMGELERLPEEGDKVRWRDIEIEVVDMDARRVDKVIARRVESGRD